MAEAAEKTIQRQCPFAKVAPRSCWQLREVRRGITFKQLPCAIGPVGGWGWRLSFRSSAKSKRQRKLLNEIFALKFCQVSCARLPPMRTSWLRSGRAAAKQRSTAEHPHTVTHTHTRTHAHRRTAVFSRSLVTDSNSRAGAGKYH